VLRAARQTDTTQENTKDWLELDEDDPGFQFVTEEEISAVIIFYLFSSALPILLNFPFIFSKLYFVFLRLYFALLIGVLVNQDDLPN
jgi:hypothetical protein